MKEGWRTAGAVLAGVAGGVVLLALVGLAMLWPLRDPKERFVRIDVHTIGSASELYWNRHRQWPASMDELVSDGFLKVAKPDSWGRPFRLERDGEGLRVRSLGPDPQDPEDDIAATVMPPPDVGAARPPKAG